MSASPFAFFRGGALVMAADVGSAAAQRHHGPGLRRRAPRELRPVRLTRAGSPVRYQRLRRDPDRRLGVGPDAPLGEPGPGRPVAILHGPPGTACRAGGRAHIPRADGRVRGHARYRRLLRAGRRQCDPRVRRQAGPTLPPVDHPRGRASRRAPRAAEDHRRHGRQAADLRPPADHHAPRRDGPETSLPGGWPPIARASRRIGACCSTATRLVDAALKVVGVGSVGLGAFVVLLEGGSDTDPLFLQVKVAEASVFERFTHASRFATHGERVVAGQRRLQAASDVLLGSGVGPHGRHAVRPAAPGPEGVRRGRGDGPR